MKCDSTLFYSDDYRIYNRHYLSQSDHKIDENENKKKTERTRFFISFHVISLSLLCCYIQLHSYQNPLKIFILNAFTL